MRLELTGRHVDITPALRRLVDAKLAQARTAAERQRRVGAGRADAREAPPPRRHHAARARRELPARRRRRRQLGDRRSTQAIDKIAQQAQKVKGKWQGRKRHGDAEGAPTPRRRPRGGARAGAARRRDARRGCRAIVRALAPGDQADVGRRRRRAKSRPAATASSSSATPRPTAISVLYRRPNGELGADRDRSAEQSIDQRD